MNIFQFYDEYNIKIDHFSKERSEQELAYKYVKKNDIVLELGARYGTVSCAINSKLVNKKKKKSSICRTRFNCMESIRR